jgi:hypothetical protein
MPTSKQLPPTPVRLPPDLKEWVKRLAESNLRSVNSEIVAILLAEKQRQDGKQTQSD